MTQVPINLGSANTKGITCICHCVGVEIACPLGRKLAKAILLLCTVNLPARALVLNMKHFNGICGCPYCEDTGQTGPPLHHFWPFYWFNGSPYSSLCYGQCQESRTVVCRTVAIYMWLLSQVFTFILVSLERSKV